MVTGLRGFCTTRRLHFLDFCRKQDDKDVWIREECERGPTIRKEANIKE
jgi:hypothetical protein